ncbi:MAG: GIY-YIG nuclease family protein [Patescibacteria group bacterium]|jgi:predicted GIY-YIG superfamily endonuclease|nr:GIY-YIG nuclease family protein [Patescibacteria group bacterium]
MQNLTYILLCSDNSFYVGHTSDLKERIKNHTAGTASIHTKNRRPIKLVYYEKFSSKIESIEREKQLKGWSRTKKINLIKFGHPNVLK